MSLHGLLSATIGVPNVAETAAYYTDFGLEPAADGWLSSRDAGRQLRIVHAPARRLVELRVGADDADDLGRAAASLARLGADHRRHGASLSAVEPATGTRVVLDVAPRLRQDPVAAAVYNAPGRLDRLGSRAPGFMRPGRVRPRKLGHAVLGSTDYRTTMAFFVDGLGFKVSDRIKDVGAFMRCSTDHHNVLVLAAPVKLLRVLLGHGLHRRRPAVDAGGPGGRPRPVCLGPSAAAVLPASRRPRGDDDRRPRPGVTRPDRSERPPDSKALA